MAILTVRDKVMRNSPITTILLVILVASSLCSVAFCWLWMNNAIHLRNLQRGAAMGQNNRTLFISLVNDTMEYSKKNAAIDPILESEGFKTKATGAATTNKPSAK